MLLAQNGSLRDALALFKENVDRVFEGERGAPRRVMTACQTRALLLHVAR